MSDDQPVWDAEAPFTNNAVLAFIWTLAEWFAAQATEDRRTQSTEGGKQPADDDARVRRLLEGTPPPAHLRRRLWPLARPRIRWRKA